MAEKPDAKAKDKEAAGAPAAPEKSGSTPAENPAQPKAKGGALKAWLPAILAIVVAPATCWAVAEFVLLPKLQAKLAAVSTPEGDAAHAAPGEKKAAAHGEKEKKAEGHGEKKGKGGKEEGGGSGDTYAFTNVVVNLSGTMGTRYLKTSFVITGLKPDTIKSAFEENKDKLTDVTLGVLSSLSLTDLEEPGAKNVLREKLVTAYNQALGSRVAEQVYFSDFVVQ
jgi:flagellar FliL protein